MSDHHLLLAELFCQRQWYSEDPEGKILAATPS